MARARTVRADVLREAADLIERRLLKTVTPRDHAGNKDHNDGVRMGLLEAMALLREEAKKA